MVSHLDTVFPPEEEQRNNFHWQPEGDRIFGPGTQDIKGGTVMMWCWCCRPCNIELRRYSKPVTWKLFGLSEERYSPDFGEVCRSRFQPVNTGCAGV